MLLLSSNNKRFFEIEFFSTLHRRVTERKILNDSRGPSCNIHESFRRASVSEVYRVVAPRAYLLL